MTRQQRRAEERARAKRESKTQFVARVYGEVMQADSIGQLWRTYYQNRFERHAARPLEPEHIALLQEVFYSGVTAMFQLMNKATTVGDSEEEIERGADRLARLYEELETYLKDLP